MSKPVIAAVALFTAVHHWNAFYDSMMYTTKAYKKNMYTTTSIHLTLEGCRGWPLKPCILKPWKPLV